MALWRGCRWRPWTRPRSCGKALANLVMMLAVQVALVPLLAALLGVPLLRPAVALVLLLGTAGYAWVGTLLAFMAANTRAQEVALPILLLPLALPLLLAAVQATAGGIDGQRSLDGCGCWWSTIW